MEQFEWTQGGKELLIRIELIIQQSGGRVALANDIIKEDRKYRLNSFHIPRVKTMNNQCLLTISKGKHHRKFDNVRLASYYMGTNPANIYSCIRQGYRCRGWDVKYFKSVQV